MNENIVELSRIVIELPKDVKFIIEQIEKAGFEAYAVGGCVRDSVLGRVASDWDITTSAMPNEVIEIFPRTTVIPTGLKHGTVTVMKDKTGYEVTTFRVDGDYFDGRHPENVQFTFDLSEDLKRRDFTINAMAYSEKTGLIDYFGGIDDINNKIVRCVGETDDRFGEDYLRMLRAYRFAGVLGFELDDDIIENCIKYKERIKNISPERITSEFNKLICCDNFTIINKFLKVFASVIYPELEDLHGIEQNNPSHFLDVYDHTMLVFENSSNNLEQRLSALFHDTGKKDCWKKDSDGTDRFYKHEILSTKITKEILKRMKYSNYSIDRVSKIISNHSLNLKPNNFSIKKLVNSVGFSATRDIIEFKISDTLGKTQKAKDDKLELLKECRKLLDKIEENKEPCFISDLKITGEDITDILDIKAGPIVGEKLNYLLRQVIKKPELNQSDILREMVLNSEE